MGGGCCQLKRDKETELKTGAADEKNGTSSDPPSDLHDLEQKFEHAINNFPFASERVKVYL